ncbi:MAG: DUF1801 domain-containing protein [Thermoplasmata archaeon]|nr:DUF1801 domain-containing protein [Thermoplasmata archaeon]
MLCLMPPRAPSGPAAIDAYLEKVPADVRAALQELRETIRKAAPTAEEVISYGMPAFRQNGILVYYAAYSDHCSLFVASVKVRRKFATELKPFAGGKGTVRFTLTQPLPPALVTRIVKARAAENAKRKTK